MSKNEEMLQFETEENNKKSKEKILLHQNKILKIISFILLIIIIILFIKIYFLLNQNSKDNNIKKCKNNFPTLELTDPNYKILNNNNSFDNISEVLDCYFRVIAYEQGIPEKDLKDIKSILLKSISQKKIY